MANTMTEAEILKLPAGTKLALDNGPRQDPSPVTLVHIRDATGAVRVRMPDGAKESAAVSSLRHPTPAEMLVWDWWSP
jgi:hypothetical protein